MTSVTVPLTDELSERLQDAADRIGVTPEVLAKAGLEDWLARPRADFLEAVRYVLEKNKELYRRLA